MGKNKNADNREEKNVRWHRHEMGNRQSRIDCRKQEERPCDVAMHSAASRAKSLGFSLQEIRELLVFQDEHTDACAEVRELLKKKLAVVHEKQAELEKLEIHLRSALRKCNRALARQSQQCEPCPVLEQMADSNPRGNHGGSNV